MERKITLDFSAPKALVNASEADSDTSSSIAIRQEGERVKLLHNGKLVKDMSFEIAENLARAVFATASRSLPVRMTFLNDTIKTELSAKKALEFSRKLYKKAVDARKIHYAVVNTSLGRDLGVTRILGMEIVPSNLRHKLLGV